MCVGLCQGSPLSLILFIIFVDRREGLYFVVHLASSDGDLQLATIPSPRPWFSAGKLPSYYPRWRQQPTKRESAAWVSQCWQWCRHCTKTVNQLCPALIWVVMKRMRLQIQAVEMSNLQRVAGFFLRDRVRSLVIQDRLKLEPLLLPIKRSQLRCLSIWVGCLLNSS